MKKLPSIFNDVIGPVMRGPSSSHTAASWRIGRTGLEILNDPLEKALVEFDADGAWAPNFREQGTVMGMDGGLLGLDITDVEMKHPGQLALQKGITIDYLVSSFPTDHANTVRLTLYGRSGKHVQIIAVSLGGGSFQIRSVNGIKVEMDGDLHEILAFTTGKPDISDELKTFLPSGMDLITGKMEDMILYELKSSVAFSREVISRIQSHPMIADISVIHPIMPVIGGNQSPMPFTTVQSLVEYSEKTGADLGDLGIVYEQCISGMDENETKRLMENIVEIINNSIDTGIRGTKYDDRILGQQSHLIKNAEASGKIRDSVVNRIIAYVSAIMESKSAMEVVVAVPTAGSAGTVGGLLRATSENIGASHDELIKAYFAAGIVGAYFAQGPGFSAEEHGCQAECGAAAGMGAAAFVQLMGGTAKQALGAASMAIQNMIGLVCDPVADRVEVPCLGKNISAAVNAYSCATMAVSGYEFIIPLDQVIQTVSAVSKMMPSCNKCTGKGGLAVTEAAVKLKERLRIQGMAGKN